MKLKPILLSIGVTVLILAPLWISHLIWWIRPSLDIDLLVVDYTVLAGDYSHHEGLFWLLNHIRAIPPSEDSKWRTHKHFIGHKPKDNKKPFTRVSEVDLSSHSLVYLADTYGVYDTDMNPSKVSGPPKLIFGGLARQDVHHLSDFASRGGDLIFEFNSFCGPTADEVRMAAEELVGVRWTGWAGRFFEDLQDVESLPTWLPSLYRKKYGDQPLPVGHGFMLIHKSGRFLLLSDAVFEKSMPVIQVTARGESRFKGTFPTPPYFGWFAIVDTAPNTGVLAEIVLPTPKGWTKAYRLEDIPVVFPLLTELQKGDSKRMYFSANLANLTNPPDVVKLAGLPLLQAAVHRRRDQFSEMPAYWQIYVPLMRRILKNAAN